MSGSHGSQSSRPKLQANTFWKVSFTAILPSKLSGELTFENFTRARRTSQAARHCVCVSWKSPTQRALCDDKRALYAAKRALYNVDRALHVHTYTHTHTHTHTHTYARRISQAARHCVCVNWKVSTKIALCVAKRDLYDAKRALYAAKRALE